MKFSSLKALNAAIEEGSLRKASVRLGVSQPALTKMLRELELELQTTLLQRTTKGVIATPQGWVLHHKALAAERELEIARHEIMQLSGNMQGEIRIGAVPLAVLLLLPETLRTFSKAYPNIRLQITEELYMAQLKRLRNKEVDIALGGIPEGLSPGEFVIEPLVSTQMVVVTRKNHPLAKATELRQLANAKWVYTGNTSDAGYAKTLHEQNNLPAPPAGALVNSTLALVSLIANGDYIGLMPSQIANAPLAQRFLTHVPLQEKGVALTVAAITRQESAVLPSIRQMLIHLHRAAHHLQKACLQQS